MNVTLQTIRGNNLFMGGVSLIFFGDFGQLPPVKDNMIWKSSEVDGKSKIAHKIYVCCRS